MQPRPARLVTTTTSASPGHDHRFSSCLPEGSQSSQSFEGHYCILDCIFHEPNQTYYVVDIMAYRGYEMYDCTAEFRLFWLQSKLAEEGVMRQVRGAVCA